MREVESSYLVDGGKFVRIEKGHNEYGRYDCREKMTNDNKKGRHSRVTCWSFYKHVMSGQVILPSFTGTCHI